MKRKPGESNRERGMALLITAASMFLIVPVVGLAIDTGFLYGVKARLSAATDAGALAAARSLNVGLTLAEQAASAEARARAFFHANFPDNYMETRNKTVTVQVAETAYRTRTVFVTGAVDAPVYFMRALGFSNTTVRSEGKASRRDVNLMLVLDRSGSMNNSNSCGPMRTAARQFVSQFANGRDRLGMITFGATYLLAYAPSMNFKTSSPSLDTTLSNITCSGGTGTAQAMWQAYQRLVQINEPGALNLMVFFTDGLPNGITATFPVKKRTDTRYGYPGGPTSPSDCSSTSSTCSMEPSPVLDSAGNRYDRNAGQSTRTFFAPNWNPNWNPQDFVGVIAGQNNATASTGGTFGVLNTTAISLSDHNETPISCNQCEFGDNWAQVRRDVAYIPSTDFYGNSTSGYAGSITFTSGDYSGRIRPDRPSAVGLASRNAADNGAQRIRNDTNLNVVTYTIGLGDPTGDDPPDDVFMRRISNDPASPIYDSNRPEGLYVFAPNNTQLNQAFARVASEILRLAY